MAEGPSDGFGIKHMVAAPVVLALLLGWGAMANAYVGEGGSGYVPGGSRRAGGFFAAAIVAFVVNAFTQLGDIGGVLSYIFSRRIGIPIIIAVAIALILGFGFLRPVWRSP